MNAPAKAHEPTMEEILASIRRIISDDDPAREQLRAPARSEPQAAQAAPVPPAVDAAEDEALIDAIDRSEEPDMEPAPIRHASTLEDDLDVLELTDEVIEEPAPVRATQPTPAPAPAAAPAREQAPPRVQAIADHLLSDKSGESVSNAFGTLAHTVLAGNARTLDDIVREMLRPMLRAWLDDNLPPLVERLVRQEIERVARGGR